MDDDLNGHVINKMPEELLYMFPAQLVAFPLFLYYLFIHDDYGVDISSVARICLHFVCLNL